MLVCNVSLHPRRGAIGVEIEEVLAATDAITTGLIFATLVDDPSSAIDSIDAYSGEIMLEMASVADSFTAGLDYAATVDETTTTTETVNGAIAGISARSAMVAGPWPVFVNSDVSREANVYRVMINL